MHLQRTINTRSCKSGVRGGGGGASGNGLVFAAPSKRRTLGDMQLVFLLPYRVTEATNSTMKKW